MTPLRRAGWLTLWIVVVGLVVDTIVWLWVTGRMRDDVAAWQSARAAEGLQVNYATPQREGWPWAAQIVLPAPAAEWAGGAWRAAAVRLRLSPWRPVTLAIVPGGAQTVTLAGQSPITLDAGDVALAAPLDQAGAAVLEARAIAVAQDGRTLQVERLSARMSGSVTTFSADQVALPGSVFAIGHASARLRATKPLPATPHGMAQWAAAGGQVVVDDAILRWGALDALAEGTLGLDAGGQPSLIATVHLVGYADFIASLVRAGSIDRRVAMVVNTALDLLGKPGNGPSMVDLPLTLAHGVWTVAGVPVARSGLFTFP